MRPIHINFFTCTSERKCTSPCLKWHKKSLVVMSLHSQTRREKLLECVLTGNSKLYLGKVYTDEQLKKLNDEEEEKLFDNYEAKLLGQMVKLPRHSIINMYSMGACAALGISIEDALSEDLENDLFLNSALQRFTRELYYRSCSFLAPLSIGIITSRHYLSERNKNGGTSATNATSGTSGDEQKLMELLHNPGPTGLINLKYVRLQGPTGASARGL